MTDLAVKPNAQKINIELATLYYSQSLLTQCLGALTSFVVLWVYWPILDHSYLIAWVILLNGLYALRIGAVAVLRRTPITEQNLQFRTLLAVLGALFSGIIWSALAYQEIDVWPPAYQAIIYLIFTGVIAGAFNSHTSLYFSFVAFATPQLIGLFFAASAYADTGRNQIMGLLALYCILMLFTSYRHHKSVVRLISTNDENDQLARELQYANDHLEEANARLAKQARTDSLTGLSNRRHYEHRLKIEWKRHQRFERPLSLIMVDIDYFKEFNDHYGHLAGDKCLVSVADVLCRNASRAHDLTARYGGDEFMIILPETDATSAAVVAKKIMDDLSHRAIANEHAKGKNVLTLSLGIVSCIPSTLDELNVFVNSADEALYKQKQAGRDGYTIIEHENVV